jgi:hypothetical protein
MALKVVELALLGTIEEGVKFSGGVHENWAQGIL